MELAKKDIIDLLTSKKWASGDIVYTFFPDSFSTTNRIKSKYEISIDRDGTIFILNSDLRSKQPLKLSINKDQSVITISPQIDGDTGFTPIILKEVLSDTGGILL